MRGIVVAIVIGVLADLFTPYDPTQFTTAVEKQLVEPLCLASLVTLAGSVLLILASDHAERRYGRFALAIRGAALPARCDKCAGEIRHLYRCCGKKLCADCYLDHASESLEGAQVAHDPPLPEETIGFLAGERIPSAARVKKLLWLMDQYEKGDPRLDEGIAKIDEIEFTDCQKCGRRLRRFFACKGKIFCTDCWLDHCAEVAESVAKSQAR